MAIAKLIVHFIDLHFASERDLSLFIVTALFIDLCTLALLIWSSDLFSRQRMPQPISNFIPSRHYIREKLHKGNRLSEVGVILKEVELTVYKQHQCTEVSVERR